MSTSAGAVITDCACDRVSAMPKPKTKRPSAAKRRNPTMFKAPPKIRGIVLFSFAAFVDHRPITLRVVGVDPTRGKRIRGGLNDLAIIRTACGLISWADESAPAVAAFQGEFAR